jgi:hypothetical protein
MYQQSIDDVITVLKSNGSGKEKRQCYEIRANIYLQTSESTMSFDQRQKLQSRQKRVMLKVWSVSWIN